MCFRNSREKNISAGKCNLLLEDEILRDLIKKMIKPEMEKRLSVKHCLQHPYF